MNPNGSSRLFLIGYRGAGKTTVAQRLAQRLGWAWVDADAVLEERAGRTVRAIFAEEGETAFRDREAAVLADLCRRERVVVATGGGVVLRPDNRERLRKAGQVVWLAVPASVLCERLERDPTTGERRPPLSNDADPRREVEKLLEVRTPLYRACADLVVEADRPVEDVVARILSGLGTRTADG